MISWTSTYRTDQVYLQNSTGGLLSLMHDVITFSDAIPYDLENAMISWTSTYRTDQGYLQNSNSGLLSLVHDVITFSDAIPYDKEIFFFV